MADPNDPAPKLETVEARAGDSPGVVRYILIVSLALVIVIFAFIIWRH